MCAVQCVKKSLINFLPIFKVDEVRSQLAASLREKQEVHENWLELERRHEKLQHDYAVKEAHNHALQVFIGQHQTSVRGNLEDSR